VSGLFEYEEAVRLFKVSREDSRCHWCVSRWLVLACRAALAHPLCSHSLVQPCACVCVCAGVCACVRATHPAQVRKLDFAVWMCSFLSTMFLGIEIGVAISIGAAGATARWGRGCQQREGPLDWRVCTERHVGQRAVTVCHVLNILRPRHTLLLPSTQGWPCASSSMRARSPTPPCWAGSAARRSTVPSSSSPTRRCVVFSVCV
jgi:hypothetical protein